MCGVREGRGGGPRMRSQGRGETIAVPYGANPSGVRGFGASRVGKGNKTRIGVDMVDGSEATRANSVVCVEPTVTTIGREWVPTHVPQLIPF